MPKKQPVEFVNQSKMRKSDKEVSKSEKGKIKEDFLHELHRDIKTLSYEESLNALDTILDNLQNDNVVVEDLKKYYLKGNLYLDHCEKLLSQVEQEVIQIDEE